ncbi:MAG: hypothetical protein ACK5EX_02650, partial [Novosphingobium sp.]
ALTRAPLTTGLGGAVGAALVVGAGWMLLGRASWLGQLRRGLGVALLLLALGLGARAMGVI